MLDYRPACDITGCVHESEPGLFAEGTVMTDAGLVANVRVAVCATHYDLLAGPDVHGLLHLSP